MIDCVTESKNHRNLEKVESFQFGLACSLILSKICEVHMFYSWYLCLVRALDADMSYLFCVGGFLLLPWDS